jgi:hypothetical protein
MTPTTLPENMETLDPCYSCHGTSLQHGFFKELPVYHIWCKSCGLTSFGDMLYGSSPAASLSEAQKLNLKLSAFGVWNNQKTLGNAANMIMRALEILESSPLTPPTKEAVNMLTDALVTRETFWLSEQRRIALLMSSQMDYLDRNLIIGSRGAAKDSTPQ